MNAYWKNRMMRMGLLLPGLSEMNVGENAEASTSSPTGASPLTAGGKNNKPLALSPTPHREPLWIG